MHYSIIINPAAGSGRGKNTWSKIKVALDAAQLDYTPVFTKDAKEGATYLAKRLADRRAGDNDEILIVVGGDGTLHEVVNGVLQSSNGKEHPLPIGYIPCGTGNDFARGFRISTNPLTALNQILDATTPEVVTIGHYHDAIKGEDGYFLNNLGIGFDAAVVSRTNASKSKRRLNRLHLGSLSYISQAMGVLYDQAPFTLMVQKERDRQLFPNAFIVVASNHPFIGGGRKIAPDRDVEEPKLELLVVERHNWLITFWTMWLFLRERLARSRFAHRFVGTRLHYTTSSLEFGQMDGEEMGNRFVDIELSTATYPFWQLRQSKQKKKVK
jgi:YegS/Rv2252/BmrU family lipid kinase